MSCDKLRIMHCFRSPVGGIFRHVRDLVHEQVSDGHDVGIICDSNTGGTFEQELFDALEDSLALGLHRIPMHRAIGFSDISALWQLYRKISRLDLDVLHSHGAKGGAYARLIGSLMRRRGRRPARLYCPHGGSIHYDEAKLSGRIYFWLERFLERFTDRLIFVSAYERDGYFEKVGHAHCPHSLVYNGLRKSEFVKVTPGPGAADFLYIGMMRDLKGVDLLLRALPRVADELGRPVSACLVGDGPDLADYQKLTASFADNVDVRFHEPMPVMEAFKLGRCLVVPSRAESFPYIVLEALAAQKQIIATHVGGIPEMFADLSNTLVEPDNLEALASQMSSTLTCQDRANMSAKLAQQVRKRFSADVMAEDVMTAYRSTLG